jgi:aerobic-type carbon monoxide dehydrogenase small subunit (CoxS/CutS family)
VKLTIDLNGAERTAEIDPRMLLVEALREGFDTRGPKVGCLSGDCGACTVEQDGLIVKSCLRLAVAAEGSRIRTIEGLARDGELTALQLAFWDHHAFQCGFCVSGMLFAAQELLARERRPDDARIRAALDGNLCRCTGYHNIVAAVRAAAEGDDA